MIHLTNHRIDFDPTANGMTSSESGGARAAFQRPDGSTTERVVVQVREMIRQGQLRPGDQLPPEREFAKRLGISRSSLRPGLRFLAAMGILNSRHGSGTFIADLPSSLESEPLKFLAALQRFTPDEMFETRRLIEVGIAGLAAERASDDHLATMADELTEMYATLDDPQQNLIHDIRFHRAVANSSGNPILAALMDMLSTAIYERRRLTVSQATNLKESAGMHRRIYRSIRARNAAEARSAMSEHLNVAQSAFASQEIAKPIDSDPKGKGTAAVKSEPPASEQVDRTLY
jgi:GntR family transcriptional regulator, transcriptional repressor for pyruvate dehydrogenase complex